MLGVGLTLVALVTRVWNISEPASIACVVVVMLAAIVMIVVVVVVSDVGSDCGDGGVSMGRRDGGNDSSDCCCGSPVSDISN